MTILGLDEDIRIVNCCSDESKRQDNFSSPLYSSGSVVGLEC